MNQSGIRILVVDDETPIRKLLRVGLTAEGYGVEEAATGRDARAMLEIERPALVILDLGLPDVSGHALLAEWRGAHPDLPILILSSRTDEAGIVAALEAGADDYVTKPFGVRELAARIRVALRHKLQEQGTAPVFKSGGLSVDLVDRVVTLDGAEVKLSRKEYEILAILVQHAGKVITHRHLMKAVWDEQTDVQYLRVYVRQLRQKLERGTDAPTYIQTETGVGYRLRLYEPSQEARTGERS